MSTDPLLASHDAAFVDGDDGRPLRILAECLRPLHPFRRERAHDPGSSAGRRH